MGLQCPPTSKDGTGTVVEVAAHQVEIAEASPLEGQAGVGAPVLPARASEGEYLYLYLRIGHSLLNDLGSHNPGNNLHVSGLSHKVDTRDLEAAFAKIGRVSHPRCLPRFRFLSFLAGQEGLRHVRSPYTRIAWVWVRDYGDCGGGRSRCHRPEHNRPYGQSDERRKGALPISYLPQIIPLTTHRPAAAVHARPPLEDTMDHRSATIVRTLHLVINVCSNFSSGSSRTPL
jgi:hypothetical protein